MKKNFKWIGIALLTAMLVFGLTGCPTPESPQPGPEVQAGEAKLSTIKLSNEVAATSIPEPIDGETYDTGFASLDAEQTGKIAIYSPTGVNYQGTIEALTATHADALVEVVFMTTASKPSGSGTQVFKEFDPEVKAISSYGAPSGGLSNATSHMYVKISNGDNVNYYRFLIEIQRTNPIATITEVSVALSGSDTITVSGAHLGTSHATAWTSVVAGSIDLTAAYNVAGASLTAKPQVETTGAVTIKYGKAADKDAAVPELAATLAGPFADGNMIYIESTAESGAKLLYKLEIRVGRNNNLASLSLSNVAGDITVAASLGAPAATAATATKGKVAPNPVHKTSTTIVAVKEAPDATVEVSVGATEGTYSTTLTGKNIVEAENIFVKVTSGNGTAQYYVILIEYSKDTSLISNVVIESAGQTTYYYDGIKVENAPGVLKGMGSVENVLTLSSKATLPMTALEAPGVFAVGYVFALMPTVGIKIEVNPTDSAATVQYATGVIGAEDGTGANALTFASIPADGYIKPAAEDHYLYVKVTAANGIDKKYYAGELQFVKAGNIWFGSPEIRQNYIDPLWDTVSEYYDIATATNSKYPSNNAENNAAYVALLNDPTAGAAGTKRNHTWGRAKVMWDDTGIYVMAVVAKHTANNFFGWTSGSEHLYDSVEIFINERVGADSKPYTGNGTGSASGATTSAYSGRGGQYRLSPDAAMSKSGDPAITSTGFNNEHYKVSGWALTGTESYALKDFAPGWGQGSGAGRAGYITIFKVPFRFSQTPNPITGTSWAGTAGPETPGTDANAGAAAPWLAQNEKQIGFDLQINVSPAAAQRMGVMVWKNTTGSNYQNCSAWGVATLKGKIGSITAQPASKSYYIDTGTAPTIDPLSVTFVKDSTLVGTPEFLWYQVIDGVATPIASATSNTFTPTGIPVNADVENVKDYSYYCKITVGTTSMYSQTAVISIKVTDALPPAIGTQPTAFNYDLSASPAPAAPSVSVVATSSDSGTLSYQWWYSTAATGGTLTEITGATNATYAPPIVFGDRYYYVVVTNTITNGLGNKTATATSNRARGQFTGGVAAQAPTWKTTLGTAPAAVVYNISAPPAEGIDAITMTVEAELPAGETGGTLSYQWYYATSATSTTATGLTLVEGATSATYVPPITAPFAARFYYCIATNTNPTVSGNPVASTANTAAVFPRKSISVAGAQVLNAVVRSKTYDVTSGTAPTVEPIVVTAKALITQGRPETSVGTPPVVTPAVPEVVDSTATFAYKWYEATGLGSNATLTEIVGQTTNSYTPTGITAAIGIKYYVIDVSVVTTVATGFNFPVRLHAFVSTWKPGEIYYADFGDQQAFTDNADFDPGFYGGHHMNFNFPAGFDIANYQSFTVIGTAYSDALGQTAFTSTTGNTGVVSAFLSKPDPAGTAVVPGTTIPCSTEFATNLYGGYNTNERVQTWSYTQANMNNLRTAGITTNINYAATAVQGNPYNIRFERTGSGGTLRSFRVQQVWFTPKAP